MRCFRRAISCIQGSLRGDLRRWHESDGMFFLTQAGIRRDHDVVDFGSNVGNYSIPAAVIAGKHGKVYAIDKKIGVLKKLRKKADSRGLGNIKTSFSDGRIEILKLEESVDFLMAYDVLHILAPYERRILYREVKRVLKRDGVFSVNLTHTKSHLPDRYFKNMELGDVKEEIEKAGFVLYKMIDSSYLHRNVLCRGQIMNFRPDLEVSR